MGKDCQGSRRQDPVHKDKDAENREAGKHTLVKGGCRLPQSQGESRRTGFHAADRGIEHRTQHREVDAKRGDNQAYHLPLQ